VPASRPTPNFVAPAGFIPEVCLQNLMMHQLRPVRHGPDSVCMCVYICMCMVTILTPPLLAPPLLASAFPFASCRRDAPNGRLTCGAWALSLMADRCLPRVNRSATLPGPCAQRQGRPIPESVLSAAGHRAPSGIPFLFACASKAKNRALGPTPRGNHHALGPRPGRAASTSTDRCESAWNNARLKDLDAL